MKKNEASFTTNIFKPYIEANPPKETVFYEIKVIKGLSFPLSTWIKTQPHQARSCRKIKNKGLWHKLSDDSRGKKPLDAFYAVNAPTKIVIYSLIEKQFLILDAERIIDLAVSGEKSIKFTDLKLFA